MVTVAADAGTARASSIAANLKERLKSAVIMVVPRS
jgi:hypothetical protein